MWGLHSAKDDHWVPIATIASFKRMRPYTDKFGVAGVAEALRASTSLLEVDEAGENVRRKTEVKEPIGQFERTAYVVSLVYSLCWIGDLADTLVTRL